MARKIPQLQKILNSEDISYDFLYHLQFSLLLALQERGSLNMIQLRYARQQMDEQRRARAKALLEQGDA